uniref:Uncharacterized protein MANES_03G032700 n=1 Tax=Rhizophora mucronata TaxID=61149 RepID=A0A2P2JXL8_RHIMU
MAFLVGLSLQQRPSLPVLASSYSWCSCLATDAISSVSCSCLSSSHRKQTSQVRATRSRRLVLGLGASIWAQFMSMAGAVAGKSFIALARQKGAIEEVLKKVEWPEQFPFKKEDFQRFDESPDSLFYEAPRFVTHIDDPAIAALTKYYSLVFPPSDIPGVSILDMCSSWVSHFPKGYKQDRVVGLGMNEEELKQNPVCF